MKSRVLAPVLVVLVVVSQALSQSTVDAVQQNTEQGCRNFVQGFYDWYVPLALHDNHGPALNLALQRKPVAFEPDLLNLLKRDSEAQAKASELVGLDFDPILNSQDPSEHFAVQSATKNAKGCLANVFGISSGQKRETVVAEARFRSGGWRFANFHYTEGTERWDLITVLKGLAADRQPKANSQHK
jgi:hypothetical protein